MDRLGSVGRHAPSPQVQTRAIFVTDAPRAQVIREVRSAAVGGPEREIACSQRAGRWRNAAGDIRCEGSR